MRQLLKNQNFSKSSKYSDIIRESMEFFLDDEENFDGYNDGSINSKDNNDYVSLKENVLSIIQRKMDGKYYKKTIKTSKKAASKANWKWSVGTSK